MIGLHNITDAALDRRQIFCQLSNVRVVFSNFSAVASVRNFLASILSEVFGHSSELE